MIIYLVRHAHAVDADDEPERPLSARGRTQVAALANFLKRSGLFQPAEFWHSPLLRARQTAELLRQRLALTSPCLLVPDLEPDDDPRAAARRIRVTKHDLAIVGHEPHLSTLATLLLAGTSEPPLVLMKKCSALALEGTGSHWAVRWHVSPDLIA
jgi:phosphohistidine phosphatase